VEKAVRKLLVASQKSGVGKTTTSINLAAATAAAGVRVLLLDADPLSGVSQALNLAEHPSRRPLRADGIDLPGIFCPGVVPALDVLSPYVEGGCSDDEFAELLRLASSASVEGGYGCLIVDAPPFMGANPGPLLRSCDELVLVMRAEPMAYRTLPAFLELVQRSRRDGRGVQMRGILLTLPDGELPGGRWERELRGRFGARILPQVIPYDEEVVKCLEAGRVIAHAHPETPVAVEYHALVGSLALVGEEAAVANGTGSPLLTTAAALEAAGMPIGRPAVVMAGAPAEHSEATVADEVVAASAEIALPPATVPDSPEDTVHEPLPTAPPLRRRPARPTPVRPVPRARPTEELSESEIPDLDELLARQALPRPLARGSRLPAPSRPGTPVQAGDTPPPSRSPKSSPEIKAPPPPVVPMTSNQPWMVWVGLATVMGVGLRFVQLPEFILPIAVGIAVAAAVILALKLLSPQPQAAPAPPPAPAPTPPSKRSTEQARPAETKQPASRPAIKKDPNARLAALARRPPSNPFPGQTPRSSEPPRSGDRRRRE
jgi:chromosome partitioning protein